MNPEIKNKNNCEFKLKFNFNNVDKNNSDDNYLNEINRNLEIINKNYNKKFRNNTKNTKKILLTPPQLPAGTKEKKK